MGFIFIFQIVISLLLVAAILFQQRGGGLSPVFGGEGGVYRTRRGIEKTVHRATVILSILFLLTALLNIILR
ncbi:MAG: preprotein translocase subunit SecG [Candidatus Sungiibacteriota bacterium]|uniref:Protein-export membrane protein SecG n=1 Tax=Candidatus Sungiibacteriota bacterium TaxID=2750080 RepID=A0A7T5RJM8_9BACT|nr:MAG: preprotein translocase subunit SecG [Candidatus Sungbacteria bacterium]